MRSTSRFVPLILLSLLLPPIAFSQEWRDPKHHEELRQLVKKLGFVTTQCNRMLALGGDKEKLLALDILEQVGPSARGSLDKIRRCLHSENRDVRAKAIEVVAGLGSFGSAATDDLLKIIKNDDPQMRNRAIVALGSTATKVEPVIHEFETLLKSQLAERLPDSQCISSILAALSQIEHPAKQRLAPWVLECAKHKEVRGLSISCLSGLLEPKEAAAAYEAMLAKTEYLDSWHVIIQSLGKVGPAAAELGPLLVKCLEMPNGEDPARAQRIRTASAQSLPLILQEDRAYLEKFIDICARNPEGELARTCILALGESIEPSGGCLEFLTNCITDARYSRLIGEATRAIQKYDKQCVPFLLKALEATKDRKAKGRVIQVFAALGRHAAEARDQLERLKKDPTNKDLWTAIDFALPKISSD